MYLNYVNGVNLIWCEIYYDLGGACGTYREEEKCIRVLVGKSEETRLFGIYSCKGEGDNEIYY